MPDLHRDLPILAFASQGAWEAWLAAEPEGSKGLWLKLAKKESGIASVSMQEAVESALCPGWIDGQGAKFDEAFWLVRFTPRKPRSKWSEVNRTRVLALIEEGRMQPAGLREVERARADGRWDAAYAPPSSAVVPDDLQRALDADDAARQAFERLNKVNRYAIIHRVGDAKKPETRARRIAQYVAMLARGETIYPQKAKV